MLCRSRYVLVLHFGHHSLLSRFCPLQELFRLYSGIDTDSSQYVTASAHRVGLEMPKEKS